MFYLRLIKGKGMLGLPLTGHRTTVTQQYRHHRRDCTGTVKERAIHTHTHTLPPFRFDISLASCFFFQKNNSWKRKEKESLSHPRKTEKIKKKDKEKRLKICLHLSTLLDNKINYVRGAVGETPYWTTITKQYRHHRRHYVKVRF